MGDGGGRAEEGRVMVARTHFSDGTYLRCESRGDVCLCAFVTEWGCVGE